MTTLQPDLFSYPQRPGFKRRATAKAAASSMADSASTLRNAALAYLKRFGPMTADEIANALCASVLAIRPRVSELANMELIEDCKLRRPNTSGRSAIVWRVKP